MYWYSFLVSIGLSSFIEGRCSLDLNFTVSFVELLIIIFPFFFLLLLDWIFLYYTFMMHELLNSKLKWILLVYLVILMWTMWQTTRCVFFMCLLCVFGGDMYYVLIGIGGSTFEPDDFLSDIGLVARSVGLVWLVWTLLAITIHRFVRKWLNFCGGMTWFNLEPSRWQRRQDPFSGGFAKDAEEFWSERFSYFTSATIQGSEKMIRPSSLGIALILRSSLLPTLFMDL